MDQLLHAVDQQGFSSTSSEVPGWPSLYPQKAQLQKCEKCPQEFCSSINYRRHVRVHHRLKNLDKVSTKNRDLLGAYWDKLSVEEAKEVVSLKDVMLEGVPGSVILEDLTTLIQRVGFSPLTHYYLRAGAALLDIVQSKPSQFPLSSQKLFTILDDSSEKTSLCGTAESMQIYVFDGEVGKVGLEPKNLIACTSFLLEQKLVKAWLADKDAEALRCQRQLVEEEEAAQKRQAEILERKRRKKLRQKEQKAREQRREEEIQRNIDSTEDALSATDSSLVTCDLKAHDQETFADSTPSHDLFESPDTNDGINGNVHSEDFGMDQYIEQTSACRQNCRLAAVSRPQGLPKSQWTVANDLDARQNSPISKTEIIKKYEMHCGQKEDTIVNDSKVWSQNSKPEIERVVSEARVEKETALVDNREVLIVNDSKEWGQNSKAEIERVVSEARVEKEPAQVDNREVLIVNDSKVLSQNSKPEIERVVSEARVEKETAQVGNREVLIVNDSKVSSQNSKPEIERVVSEAREEKEPAQVDNREVLIVNDSKVSSQNSKPEIERVVSLARVEKERAQVDNREVLIGSISITLGNCSQTKGIAVASREDSSFENLTNQNKCLEKPMNLDFVQSVQCPVSGPGAESPVPDQNCEAKAGSINGNEDCQNSSNPSCKTSYSTDGSDIGFENKFSDVDSGVGPGSLRLIAQAAKAFLAQRWKEAMSSNDLVVVVSSDSKPPGSCQEIQDTRIAVAECQSSEVNKRNILANAKQTQKRSMKRGRR